MKKFTLLIMLLVTMVTTATAQLTEGAVYQIVNKGYDKALLASDGYTGVTEAAGYSQTEASQLWVLEAGSLNSTYNLRNVGTGEYLNYDTRYNTKWPVRANAVDFHIAVKSTVEEKNYYSIGFMETEYYSAAHIDADSRVVRWGSSANPSQWEFTLVHENEAEYCDVNDLVCYTYEYTYGTRTIKKEVFYLAEGDVFPDVNAPSGFTITTGTKPEGTVVATGNETVCTFECEITSNEITEETNLEQIFSTDKSPWYDTNFIVPRNVRELDNSGTVHIAYTGITIGAGEVKVLFDYIDGDHRLDIMGVDIINPETWQVVSFDYHSGSTGGSDSNNTYTLNIENDGTYIMRYFVNHDTNGNDLGKTSGKIYVSYKTYQTVLNETIETAEAISPVAGTTVGTYTSASVEAFNTALITAKAITEDAILQNVIDLKNAINALVLNMPVAGQKYFIISGLEAFKTNLGVEKAIYANGTAPAWCTIKKFAPEHYWEVYPISSGGYAIKNCGTGQFLKGKDQLSDTEFASTLTFLGSEQFNIISNGNVIHANSHGGGTGIFGNIVGYSGIANSASAWKFVAVSEDDYASAILNTAIGDANNAMAATIVADEDREDEEISLSTSNVTAPQDHQLINPDGNEYYGQDGVERMLDGNNSTYMHTAWSNVPDGPHYIQIDLGEGNDIKAFQFHTINRNAANDKPKTWLIQGSNDNERFTDIATITNTDNSNGAEFYSPAFASAIAYRYLRFNVIDCYPSYRTYFHIAEFDLYKATIDDADRNTELIELLSDVEDLFTDGTVEEKNAKAAEIDLAANYSTITYNFTYDGTVYAKAQQEDVKIGSEYPAITVTLPIGVTASAPEGTVADDETKEIECTVDETQIPFDFVAEGTPQTWYYAQMHTNADYTKYIKANTNNITWSDNLITSTEEIEAYLWGFVGTPLKGFQIVNKGGAAVVADGTATPSMGELTSASNLYAMASVTGVEGTFCMQCSNDQYLNGQKGAVAYWGSNDAGSTFLLTEYEETSVNVSSVGYATLYLDHAVYVPSGVEAYYITEEGVEDGYVVFTQIDGVIPANTGVVLKNAGEFKFINYAAAKKNDPVTAIEDNLLKGTVATENVVPTSGMTAYVLSAPDGAESIGFYEAELNQEDGTAFRNNAGKAYLEIETANGAPAFYGFDFGEGTTGIDEITENRVQSTVIYDLTGRRVETITEPGIYIVGGKKILVK